jgi:DNA invertase Pin-like site-specific DNA recombinase
MRNKGRGWNPVGVEVKCAKLDENKVRVIRDLFRDGKYQTEIAKLFGVDSSTISTIVNRKSWKHVE